MTKGTDVNFAYIPGERYIVEIKDKQTGETHFTERICGITRADVIMSGYNRLKNFAAKIHDTKTGKVLEGDFASSG